MSAIEQHSSEEHVLSPQVDAPPIVSSMEELQIPVQSLKTWF